MNDWLIRLVIRRPATWRALVAGAVLVFVLAVMAGRAQAQQFNSDNYLTMPHGTATMIITSGTEYWAMMTSFALFPRWEFFAGGFMSWEDSNKSSTASWSSTLYAKYMPYENKAKNGGLGIAFGTGNSPGHLEKDRVSGSFRTYWVLPEGTIPFFDGKLSWDLNPGFVLNTDYGKGGNTKTGFLYSTRVAGYGVIPQCAIVGEVYGTSGAASVEPQYRAGIRWKPNSTFVGAVT